MATEPISMGYNARVKVNDVLFRVVSGNAEINYDKHPANDSETGRTKTSKRGMYSLTASLVLYARVDTNIHGGSFMIGGPDDEELSLKIYHNGIDEDPYECASFSAYKCRVEWEKEGGGVKVTLEGESNGDIVIPGTN